MKYSSLLACGVVTDKIMKHRLLDATSGADYSGIRLPLRPLGASRTLGSAEIADIYPSSGIHGWRLLETARDHYDVLVGAPGSGLHGGLAHIKMRN